MSSTTHIRFGLFVAVTLSLGAQAAATYPTAKDPIPTVMAELRKIEAAQYHSKWDPLRMEYELVAREEKSDPMIRVYIAWGSMVSDGAWNQLKAIATIYPDLPWVHFGMGKIYTVWKMRDQARQEFEQTLKKNPKFYPSIGGLGDLALAQGDTATAEAKYREALAIEDDPQIRGQLGLLLYQNKKVPEATAEMLKAAEGMPEQPAVLAALVQIMNDAKDPRLGDVVAKLADIRPRDRATRKMLGDMRYDAGELDVAIAEYEKLLKLGDPDREVVKRTAEYYRSKNDAENEERLVKLWSRLDTEDANLTFRLAQLRFGKSDQEGAEKLLLDTLQRDPKRPDALVQLGEIRAKENKLHEAALRYRAAAALTGPSADQAKTELEKLEATLKLPKKKPRGTVDSIYWGTAKSIEGFFNERLRVNPNLGGAIKVRVRIDGAGVVQGADVLEDTVGDPMVTAHTVLTLVDSGFEKKKREPVFEFELGKKKTK